MIVWFARLAALRAHACRFRGLAMLHGVVLSAMLAACGGGGGGGAGASVAPQVTIMTQPADAHVTAGQPATFSVNVAGAASYRWQTGGPANWTDIAGANAASYTFTPGVVDSGAQFRVVVVSAANSANTLTSIAATLTVDAALVAIQIDQQPQFTGTAYVGEMRTLSVTVEGTSPAYRWQRSDDHGTTWVDIPGATEPGWTLQPAIEDDGALVHVVVSNALGQRTSDAATLAVRAAPATPLFTTAPAPATVPVGTAAAFNAVAVGDPAPALKWQTAFEATGPWIDIAGATGGTYVITATTPADDGRLLRAVATNANGSALVTTSLSISASSLAPGFSEQPTDVTSATGYTITFSAHGYGAPSVTYQWQLSTDGGASFGNINGANSRFYVISQAALADNDKRVRVVVSNSLGSATSQAAHLVVMDPPVVTSFSSGERWRPGVTGAYFVAAATGGQLQYQWQLGVAGGGPAADVPGATARDFVMPASTPASVTQVCVKVSNLVGSLQRCAPVAAITWRPLRPTPMDGAIATIARTGASTAVAGGAHGALLRTTDAGLTWTPVSDASWSQYTTLSIAMHGQHGVAVGGYDTRFTADGGQHWYTGPQDFFPAEAAAYAPDGTLVKVGDTGVRLSSDDGMTWRNAAVDSGLTSYWRVAFNSAGVGIAVGVGQGVTSLGNTGAIARSSDGGATWTTVQTSDAPVRSVAFATDNVVVAVDWHGNIWRSTDAGLTWTARYGVVTQWGFETVAFLNANVGVVYGGVGQVWRTSDGGATWALVGPVAGMQVIMALDANTLLAGGTSGSPLRSVDGGLTWTTLGRGDGPTLEAAAFVNASIGIVVGTQGTIERTTDGGATWNTVNSGTSSELEDVRFGDATHGLAVGWDSVVLRTSDAGASWQVATPPQQPSTGLRSVAYATPGVAFVAGDSGLWKTTDAGATWQSAGNFGNSPIFLSVRFGDALHGLASAQGRQLWRTTDGGQTWNVVTTNFDQNNNISDSIGDMTFITPTTVVGVTGAGLIVRSTDAGATWQVTPSGMTFTSHVYFRDAQVGIVVGNGILRTTDGGLTWSLDQGALQPWSVGGAAAIGAHSMIVVGADDQIYRNDGF